MTFVSTTTAEVVIVAAIMGITQEPFQAEAAREAALKGEEITFDEYACFIIPTH